MLESIRKLFEDNLTPSLAYFDYIQQLRKESKDELDFHEKKADRSFCPRRRDFNYLYKKFCNEKFGSKNGEKMFLELERKINTFQEDHADSKVSYQPFDMENNNPLIIALVTPLMARVHEEVLVVICFCEHFCGNNISRILSI